MMVKTPVIILSLIVWSISEVYLKLCPSTDWIPVRVVDGGDEFCLKNSTETANWTMARDLCRKEDAFLWKPYVGVNNLPSLESMVPGGQSYWTGLHVHKRTGRLVWDEIRPYPAVDFQIGSGVQWNHHLNAYSGQCVSTQRSPALTATLQNCLLEKQFFCQHPGISVNVTKGDHCYQDWYGDVYGDACYQLNYTSLVTKTQATSSGCFLVAPKNSLEFKFVSEYLTSNISQSNQDLPLDFWTGLTYDIGAGEYQLNGVDLVSEFNDLPVVAASQQETCGVLRLSASDAGPNVVTWVWRNCSAHIAAKFCQLQRLPDTSALEPTIQLKNYNLTIPASLNRFGRQNPIELPMSENQEITFTLSINSYPDETVFYRNFSPNPPLKAPPHELQGYYWYELWRLHPLSKRTTKKLLLLDSEILTYRCMMNLSSLLEVDPADFTYYNFYGVVRLPLQQLFSIVNETLPTELMRVYLGSTVTSISSSLRGFRQPSSQSDTFVLFDVYIKYEENVTNYDGLIEMQTFEQALNITILTILQILQIRQIPWGPIPQVNVLPTRRCFPQTINGIPLGEAVPGQIYNSTQFCPETGLPSFVAECSGDFLEGLEWKLMMENCNTTSPINESTSPDTTTRITRETGRLTTTGPGIPTSDTTGRCFPQTINGIPLGEAIPGQIYNSTQFCPETGLPSFVAECSGDFLEGLEWKLMMENCNITSPINESTSPDTTTRITRETGRLTTTGPGIPTSDTTGRCFPQTINGIPLGEAIPGQIYNSTQFCPETGLPSFVAECSGDFLEGLEWKLMMENCNTTSPINESTSPDTTTRITRETGRLTTTGPGIPTSDTTGRCFPQTINGIPLGEAIPGQIYNSTQFCPETGLPSFVAVCSGDFLEGLEWKLMMENCKSTSPINETTSPDTTTRITRETGRLTTTGPGIPTSNTTDNSSTAKPTSIHTELNDLLKREFTDDTVFDIAQSINNISSNTSQLDGEAVSLITQVIERIVSQPTLDTRSGGQMCLTIQNLIRVDSMLPDSQKMNSTSRRLLQALDKYTDIARLGSGTILQPYEAFAVEMWDLTPGLDVNGFQFIPETAPQTGSKRFSNQTLTTVSASNYEEVISEEANLDGVNVAIYLPPSLIKKRVSENVGENVRLSFIVYNETSLFNDSSLAENNRSLLNGNVISATFGNKKIQGLPEDQRIRTVFRSDQMLKGSKPACVFWDFSMNGDLGGWSESGCHVINTTRRDGYYECSCDHLTNFAVLIDYGDRLDDVNNQVLTVITIIGLSLSTVGLTLTVLTFILFKKARSGNNQKTLFCLSVSLLTVCILFLVGIVLSQENLHDQIACKIVAILLHYFLLTTFMWMLMEAVLHYLSFVIVMNSYVPKFLLKASIAAWAIPIIPVVIVLAINHNLYYRSADVNVTKFCWMDQYTSYFAFLIPIGLIIIVNAVIFIRIVWTITHRPKGLQTNQSKTKMHFISLKAAIACFILLGLTWIFGFLAIENARLVFQYVFTILNSFQGLFIFLIFTLRDEKVRQYWRSLCCKGDRKNLYTSSDGLTNKRLSEDSSSGTTNTELQAVNNNGQSKFRHRESTSCLPVCAMKGQYVLK